MQIESGPATPSGPTPASPSAATAEDTRVALRMELIDTHRRAWRGVRRLGRLLLRKALRDDAPDDVRLTVCKLLYPGTKTIPDAESRVWGLDADLLDRDSMSHEQIQAVAAGKPV